MNLSLDLSLELINSGWFPTRKILLKEDSTRSLSAQKFLEEFGNLVIRRTNIRPDIDWFDFYFERVQRCYSAKALEFNSHQLGSNLYFIGGADCDHCALFIDAHGRFFMDTYL